MGKRRYKNCRKIEARKAYKTAVHLTNKQIWLRRWSWFEVKLELLDIWLYSHRKEIALFFLELLGCFVFVYLIYRFSLYFGRLMR